MASFEGKWFCAAEDSECGSADPWSGVKADARPRKIGDEHGPNERGEAIYNGQYYNRWDGAWRNR
jgi:hypothetical protein